MQLPKIYTDPSSLLTALQTESESYWMRKGEERVLQLFQQMSQRVPAYKDFLNKHGIDSQTIQTIDDLKKVPTIDKNNYLRAYPREQLCWDGDFKSQRWTISTTSGSTGEPYYFPRSELQDTYYAIAAELYLLSNFSIDKKSTLYIIGFPMGAWIGGLFTYQAIRELAHRGKYPLSIITPGINKLEILKAVKNLGDDFDQIIIGSYAPFLKDILDDGEEMGIDWKKYNLGFIFSAEGFSETFRDYVVKKTGLKNVYKDTLNHYGTVDLGTMSHETPLSILLRRRALEDKQLYADMFNHSTKLPTLTQYNPELFYFESEDNNLICSSFSGLPLCRYDLKDHGGIISFDQMQELFAKHNLSFDKEIEKAAIADTVWKLPFVYVYERNDFSVSFFAFQIYPETIRHALQEKSLEQYLTGKFTMLVNYDDNHNQVLEINVECKRAVEHSGALKQSISDEIVKRLLAENSEYRKTAEEYPERVIPEIVLWPYEDPLYFKAGTKQKWVKK